MILEEERELCPVFGRDEILARLEQRLEGLKKGYRQNVGLVGPRFIGKTTLLTHFLERVRRDPEVISIYVSFEELDFEAFCERWLGGLLQGVLASKQIPFPEEFQPLVKIARTFIPKTLERMKEAKKHALRKKWNIAFRELLSLTATLEEETGKKILLILDEFQDLSGLELPDPFGLFGKEMMIQKNTFYLASSSKPRESLEIFHQRLSLLFGNFEIMTLGPLKQEAVRQWAAERCQAAPIPESELRVLSHLLDNHPYYLNLFFQEAEWQLQQDEGRAWDRGCSLKILESLLFSKTGPYNLFFESRLRELVRFGHFTRPYLKTLVALAQGRVKPMAIAAYTNRKASEVQKILSRLVEEGGVEKQNSFYCLTDPLFRLWLRKVYSLRERNLEPDGRRVTRLFRSRLCQELQRIEEEDRQDLTERVSSLFREFRNENVVVGPLKIKCPTFLEMAARPTNGRYFPISARTTEGRWFCQVVREPVTEADVTQFVEDLKQSRQKIQSRILVALGGIELNARLLAQEAKIQIWDLESFNALLNLFGKLKVIVS